MCKQVESMLFKRLVISLEGKMSYTKFFVLCACVRVCSLAFLFAASTCRATVRRHADRAGVVHQAVAALRRVSVVLRHGPGGGEGHFPALQHTDKDRHHPSGASALHL